MSDIKAGGAFVELTLRDKVTSGLVAAQQKLQAFGAASLRLSAVFGGLSAAIIAPLTAAVGGLIVNGKMDKLLALWQELSGTIQEVAQELATAIEPVLGGTVSIMNGIAIAASKWLKENAGIVKAIAQVGAGLGAIAAALAAIGVISSGIGSGFGVLAKIIPVVTAFLATPLGMFVAIAGAIGLGVAAWVRFTDSGKAAAKFFIDFFTPAIEFVKKLVGGIGDALSAGDFVLAGKIAIKGLQIVFGEGVNAIADLIGGTLGNAIGEIGKQIVSGDFSGAWKTAVAGMAKLWADFSNGVVSVFSAAAKAVVDKWQQAVGAIAGGLLKASAGGGVLGKIASTIIGADVAELQAENDRLDKARGIKQDIFGIGAGSIADSTNAIAGPIKGFLDSMGKAAEDIAAEADTTLKRRLEASGGLHRTDVGALTVELDKLRKKAAEEKAALAGGPALPAAPGGGPVAVGFSGAALQLQLQGGGGTVQGRIAKATEDSSKKLDTATGLLEAIKERLKAFSVTA